MLRAMEAVEERVDSLEATLRQFMAQSNRTIERLDENIIVTRREIVEIREEIGEVRGEIAEIRHESRRHTLEMAHIAARIGRFAEDFVNPNIPRLAKEVFGVADIEFEGQRLKRRHASDASRMREFDYLLVGNRHLILSEAKLTARADDVNAFAEGVKDIFHYFPEFRGFVLAPIFASLALGADVVRRLTRLKIYGLALGERTMELLNLEEVRSRRG